MTTVQVPLSFFTGETTTASAETEPPRDCYFQRKHHCPWSYSRIENWLPDVKDYTFLTELVCLSGSQANAILKYRDETKLRAAVDQIHRNAAAEDSERKGECESRLEDPCFLDHMFEFIMKDWPQDGEAEVRGWHSSLVDLQDSLEAAIRHIDREHGNGTFVKLSNRSPKDASLNMTRTYDDIRSRLRTSTLRLVDGKATPETVNEDFAIMNYSCAESLRVRDGAHALRLLLESERIYTDISLHQLNLEDGESFNLQIAVREWCPDLDPDWEFRLFVVGKEPTALTSYNDFFYDDRVVHHKATIEQMIMEMWGKVQDRIHQHTSSYCIDFAVTPDVQRVFVIEVNNFLPPLAGSGLFRFHNAADLKLLDEGPFTFRIREFPLSEHEQATEGGGVRTLHPPLLALMRAERSRTADASDSRCAVS